MSQHLADDVLTSLSRIAQDSAVSLRELSARIDLKKDAQELKYVFGMVFIVFIVSWRPYEAYLHVIWFLSLGLNMKTLAN